MSRCATIMLDYDLEKKLKFRQAKLDQQEKTPYSFSKVINEVLKEGLK